MTTDKGVKLDIGKNRLGLVFSGFPNALWGLGQVGTFGANKYTDNGWQSVDNGYNRYQDALFRHLFNNLKGEEIDSESELPHLFHALWNICAMIEFKYGDVNVQ